MASLLVCVLDAPGRARVWIRLMRNIVPAPDPGNVPAGGGYPMAENAGGVRLGQKVPDFEMETFEAGAGKFGKFSMAAQRQKGRWTLLFFYPADFTFV
jgi:AhpC/TSA family